MRRIFQVSFPIYFALIVFGLQAQTPDWVKTNGKSSRYPTPAFLTGYSMAVKGSGETNADAINRAYELARKNLIEQVAVSVKSITQSSTTEINNKSQDYFNVATQAYASMDLEGLLKETHYDKSKSYAYAFAYVPRTSIIKLYADRVQKHAAEAQTHFKNGQSNETNGNRAQALNDYLDALGYLHRHDEASTLLRALGSQSQDIADLTIATVRERINTLYNKPIASLDDLAFFLAFCLKSTVKDIKGNLVVSPLTYQDTKFNSAFSRYFQSVLQNKVGAVTNLRPVEPNHEGSGNEALTTADAVLVGSYWELNEQVKVLITLRSARTGKILASAEKLIDAALVKSTGLELKPQNLIAAQQDQKIFTEGEVIENNGLNIEVWTNRGDENVVFGKGDTMAVYVKTNLPCYVRLLYHMADGQHVLLLKNYYIDLTLVNKKVRVPGVFECDAPFGAEVLQVLASTHELTNIATHVKDGYDFVVGDLQSVVAQTRGMRRKDVPNANDILSAEKRVTITTVDKIRQ